MLSPTLGRFLSRDPLPLSGQPDILFDNNWFGQSLNRMSNLYRYTSNNPTNFTDPSGLISEADLTQAVTDLKACGAANDLFKKATDALNKEPKGKNITITTRPIDDLPDDSDSSNVMTGSIRIMRGTQRCNAFESMLVELSHIANRITFIKMIQNACNLSRSEYIRQFEQNEFNSTQSAVKVWKECSKNWKCKEKCPTYGDPDAYLKQTFDEFFKNLSKAHKERIGEDWDRRCT